jgi:hypothetical protein
MIMRGAVSVLVALLTLISAWPATGVASPPSHTARSRFAAAADGAASASFVDRHRKPLLWITGLTAAGSAVTAISLRQLANDRFAQYEQAADPERITQLYDETAQLDDLATVFFIVAEVSFLAAMFIGFFVEDASVAGTGPGAPLWSGARIEPEALGARLVWRF